ncbi:hypothetical protein D515_02256 [Grimontia indica]|uniref:Uncharacterized protein n=1 Tax=Grimontia indica TaxID=1056512 RepID=R1IDB4_9GAMM|nr:hypothetical protein [Grimontia indica]EOD78751.1 hypothetical protein D515_02256 [Grimontia indica]
MGPDKRFYRWGEERRYGKFSYIVRTALFLTIVLLSSRLASLFLYEPTSGVEAFFLQFPTQILMFTTLSVLLSTLGWYLKEAWYKSKARRRSLPITSL